MSLDLDGLELNNGLEVNLGLLLLFTKPKANIVSQLFLAKRKLDCESLFWAKKPEKVDKNQEKKYVNEN